MSDIGSCYSPTYLQASFNGVPFEAMEASSSHGRRGAEGEFPFSDQTGYVDLGRGLRKYTLTARLAGDNHLAQSTLLIAACEVRGPGILVHPTRGVINAACVKLTVTDRVVAEQGVTHIELEFVEGSVWQNGFGLVGSLLGLVLRPLLQASSTTFRARYSVQDDPVYRQAESLRTAETLAENYVQMYRRIPGSNNRAASELEILAEDPVRLGNAEDMDELVRKASAAIAAGTEPSARFELFRTLANAGAGQPLNTPSEQALVSHIRVTSAGYMAQAALAESFSNLDDVWIKQAPTAQLLEEEASIAYELCQNDLFQTLRDFGGNFDRQMNQISSGVPARMQFDFGGVVSPLAAAYAIWDDATRARELSASNVTQNYGNIGPVVRAVPDV